MAECAYGCEAGEPQSDEALRHALRKGVSELALAIGTLEAHWEFCCGDPEHLPPVQLRTTLTEMDAALRRTQGGHEPPCQLADAGMTKEQILQAMGNHVDSGIDTYVFMRFKEGHGHLASKEQAFVEAVEGAMDWLGLTSYTPPEPTADQEAQQ